MLNQNNILVIFNKPIRMGSSSISGFHVSANGIDISRNDIAGFGTRFIKISPRSVDLIFMPHINTVILRDKRNRDCVVNQNDVDIIKELETDKILWTSPKASEIVIELDSASRAKPQIVPMPNSGPVVVQFDSHNTIPLSWTVGLDFKTFPFLMKLHAGITFKVKDANWLEFEFLGDVSPFETFYVSRVYKRNGGAVLWQKPQKVKP